MDAADAKQQQRRQQIVQERQVRLAHTLRRLFSHPFVDPRAPHGPHGRPPSPPTSDTAAERLCADSDKSYITWAVFNNLVTEQLGIRPQSAAHVSAPPDAFHRYLSKARAVSSKPSLTGNAFLHHLSTGHDTATLCDKDKLDNVAGDPLKPPRDLFGANVLHQRVQRLKKQRRTVEKNEKPAKRARVQCATPASPSQTLPREWSPSPDQTAAPSHRMTRSAAKKLALGRSASQCCFCPDLAAFNGKELESELIGPFVDRRGHARLFVHFECACWAPQVYTDAASGQLRRVYDEYCRGRQLKCAYCGDRGATIGCYVQRCKKVYHLRCLRSSGAYTVDRFFAAFCSNHAHLGKEQTYITLMEAATIADVAAAQRRDDSTFGLDAPHSRYTMLRRRETEVIFSRQWKICSHTAVYDSTKVLFSHKRRKIISRRDKLCNADRVKALRASAIDIASGRIAYLAVLGEDAPKDDAAAFQVRAALASRDVPSLLLLRNLRRAPEWDKEDIQIVKKIIPSLDRNPKLVPVAKDAEIKADRGGCSPQVKGSLEQESEDKEPEEALRSLKRIRHASRKSPVEGRAVEDVIRTIPLQSAKLPPVGRIAKISERDGLSKHSPSHTKATDRQPDANEANEGCTMYPIATDPTSDAAQESKSIVGHDNQPNLQSSTPNQLKKNPQRKIKSAWEVFLEHQLPKERMLRPDDSTEDSMRNMARLWSLMTVAEREEYEQLAQQEFLASMQDENVHSQELDRQRKSFVRVKGKQKSHTTNAGLFVKSNISASNPNNANLSSENIGCISSKQPSRALPSIRRHSITRTQSQHMDWDELFPTSLRGIFPGKILDRPESSRLVPRVRPPPGHGKSVT